MKDKKKLRSWKDKYEKSRSAFEDEILAMDEREKLYKGSETIHQIVCRDFKKQTKHVRNVIAEIIESQVNSNIPQPKVTARRKEDEYLAKIIEDMLRNEIDRLPFEVMNDEMSRTVPIQGGGEYMVEWDETQRTHTTSGEIVVSALHPKKVIPQDGVFTIQDMDYIFVEMPQTKEYVKTKYGVDVYKEYEKHPEIRDAESDNDEMVTQIIAFFRNDKGGIGKFSWVGDTILEDLDNYQARRVKRCVKCGAIEPLEALSVPSSDDPDREEMEYLKRTKPRAGSGKAVCPYCGSDKFEMEDNDYEELEVPLTLSDGTQIPPFETWQEDTGEIDELGQPVIKHRVEPVRIPYYCPNVYPVVLVKNTSLYGKFLGSSDVDTIAYQQNTINRLSAKICDKLMKSGSYLTKPAKARVREDGEDSKFISINEPKEKELFGVFNMQPSIEQDMAYLDHCYEEARQIIGVTDSFQGRHDPTATSGKAKEFAAAQSAGRLESKRVMRDWAYSELFKLMFMFKLAYADEPRPVVSRDENGDVTYKEFNRYDFLRKDDAGNWYWLDDFIFSCDVTAPLANNREAMWDETRMNFQQGTFGNPADLQTLILFWSNMATLHYPGAEDNKTRLQEMYQQQQMMMMQQQAIEQQAMQAAQRDLMTDKQLAEQQEAMAKEQSKPVIPPNMQSAIDNMARQQVMQDLGVS